MKNNLIKLIWLSAFSFMSIISFSQVAKSDVDELNKILKNSLYKTSLAIDQKGEVNRKDNNGNIFVYNLSDVSEVKYLDDGFPCAMLVLKAGKKSKGQIEGALKESNLNVIAFNARPDCDKAIEILKKVVKSFN